MQARTRAPKSFKIDSTALELKELGQSLGGSEAIKAAFDGSTSMPTSERELEHQTNAVPLPPIDGGIQAWTFIAASFVLEALVWGFGAGYGVFQEWYKTNPPFNNASESAIGAIGTTALAIEYGEFLLILLFVQKWPHLAKASMWTGLAFCCGSLFISSFATEVWHLILLQGVLFGIGGGFFYAPVILWLSEWFVQRRGFAGSVIFGGTGFGGALFPIITNLLLTHTGGFRWTLRIWAAIMAISGSIALIGIKPRLPVARAGQAQVAPVSFNFLKNPIYHAVTWTILVQSLAYFPVSLYLPTYTTSIGLSRVDGGIVLSVFNVARVVGQLAFGHLVDRVSYVGVMAFSGISAALSAYLLLGFAHNLGLIFAFCVVFGSLSGGFTSVWPSAVTDISGGPDSAMSPVVFGSFCMFTGVAAVVGPMIASVLYHPPQTISTQPHDKFGGYGFTAVTLFVGNMMLVTSAGSFATLMLRKRR